MKRSTLVLVFSIIFLSNTSSTFAQEPTFGPVCDGVTVTCVPTPSPTTAQQLVPTETPTPSPTETPTPTPSPTRTPTPSQLPRAGDTTSFMTLFAVGAVFVASGLIGKKLIS